MVTKDWKKPVNSMVGGVDTTFFENKKKQLKVIGHGRKGEYYVALENYSPYKINILIGSRMKNKTKAMAFARSYMRKH